MFGVYHDGERMFWGSDNDYGVIEPAIRMASVYLSSPRSLLFINSLVYETKRLSAQFHNSRGSNFQFQLTEDRDSKVILPRIYRIWFGLAAQ